MFTLAQGTAAQVLPDSVLKWGGIRTPVRWVAAAANYQLIGGATTLDARYLLESDAGEVVVVRNCGPFDALIPVFEARSAGPFGFLNTGKFISSDPGSAAGGVTITFYELN